MDDATTVILFTGSYPYDAAVEHTFLDPEMNSLCAAFDRVILIPSVLKGNRLSIPQGVIVEESYAKDWQNYYQPLKAVLSGFFSKLFWSEILRRPKTCVQMRPLKKTIWISTNALFTANWLSNYIQKNKLDPKHCVFYTYWLDHITLGISLAKQHQPDIKLISRAHHYDLYEYFYQPAYIPYRSRCLESMDALYLISDDGKSYMEEKHPRPNAFYKVSRLGVKNPGFTSQASSDGIFRIASCSFIVPFKRIDLLLDGINQLALSQPQQKFEWHHLGDGPLLPYIKQMVENVPSNLTCRLWGYLPNERVMTFYREQPVDVFINVSQSEGIPVSIMEAQSCGIPVIATAVGGSPEIVTEENGLLLPKNPSPQEISAAINQFVQNPATAQEKRNRSYSNWKKNVNAELNFTQFAQSIRTLIH